LKLNIAEAKRDKFLLEVTLPQGEP